MPASGAGKALVRLLRVWYFYLVHPSLAKKGKPSGRMFTLPFALKGLASGVNVASTLGTHYRRAGLVRQCIQCIQGNAQTAGDATIGCCPQFE